MNTILIDLALVATIAVIVLAKFRARAKGSDGSYNPKPLLTPNELEFLGRLEQSVPEMRFHAQVAMGSIIEPNVSRRENGKEYWRLRGNIAQKIIDFVAQDRTTGNIVAIIELDDRTHNGDKDAERDLITGAAGFKTIRWHSKRKPDTAEIRAQLIELPSQAKQMAS